MTTKQNGTVFVNHGLWYYAVKLPGEKVRKQVPLKAAGSDRTLTADRPFAMAKQAAARYWETKTRGTAGKVGNLVEDVCRAYCDHAAIYYRHDDGTPTSEVAGIRIGVRLLREMFGSATVGELTHGDLVKWRDAMERSGIARTTVNKRVGMVKRMWTWALDVGMISATERAELSQVGTLKRGRCLARETEPVRPVDDETVAKTQANMMPNTADMVEVQRRTGMRPEEVCAIRWADIDTTVTPWVFRPRDHKNKWRGMPRVILIGPRAREVLNRHRESPVPFSPQAAMVEWFAAKRAAATSPSHQDRRDPHNPRVLGERWTTDGYGGTIRAACERAGIPSWGANRLRHTFGTEVRRRFGLAACRAVLGHSAGGGVTDRYSFDALEDEIIRDAAEAVEALG